MSNNFVPLITGNSINQYLTGKEQEDLRAVGLLDSGFWQDAVLTGSVAYGNATAGSDIDIFIRTSTYTTRPEVLPAFLSENGWKEKSNIVSEEGEGYTDSCLNVVKGRINLFTLKPEAYSMYLDATRLCMQCGGNKQMFKAFCALAKKHGWYE